MPTFRTGLVTALIAERPGLQRVWVRLGEHDAPSSSGLGHVEESRAYVLTELTGPVEVGDEVVCNTTAVELGLGTGGWHFVHWNMSRRSLSQPGPDHVMKLRYTSLQIDAGTDELVHPAAADRPLGGVPVVACSLHSQMAVVAATVARLRPEARIAYVMTDGAALPLAMSDLVVDLVAAGVLCGTVSAGHAFGGDLEAVSVASALGLARHVLNADAIVVAMGPGVVGTGTALGTTSVEVAHALDLARKLGGIPVLAVRASDGDGRGRHQGVSHHTATAARLCSAAPLVAPVPPEAATLIGVESRAVGQVPDPVETLELLGLRVTTMGRGPDADPLFFQAAAAAGTVVAELLG